MQLNFEINFKQCILTAFSNSKNEAPKLTPPPIREFVYRGEKYSVASALAIQNYANSGTTLIKSLFDNHPNIATSASILNMSSLNALHKLKQSQVLESIQEIELILFIMNIVGIICEFNLETRRNSLHDLGLTTLGDGRNENVCIPLNVFMLIIKRVANETNPEPESLDISFIYLLFTLSYRLTLWETGRGPKPKNPIIFVWDIHGGIEDTKYFLQDFPSGKFLHTLRRPMNSFDGMFVHLNKRSLSYKSAFHPFSMRIIDQLFLDVSPAYGPNSEKIKRPDDYSIFGFVSIEHYINRNFYNLYPEGYPQENIRALFLEDVHLHTRKCTVKLCEWMGIPFDDCLLQTTVEGKVWHNRSGSDYSGLNKTFTGDSKYLYSYNKFIIEHLESLIFSENFSFNVLQSIKFLLLATLPLKSEKIEYISPHDVLFIISKFTPKFILKCIDLQMVESHLIALNSGNWVVESLELKNSGLFDVFIRPNGKKTIVEKDFLNKNGFEIKNPQRIFYLKMFGEKESIVARIVIWLGFAITKFFYYINTRRSIYRAYFLNSKLKFKTPKKL